MKYSYPTVEETATRVVQAYRAASDCADCDTAKTSKWYTAKRRWIYANRGHLSKLEAITVYACMSQNKSVPENDKLFLQYVATGTFSHFPDVIRRVGLATSGRLDLAIQFKNAAKISSFAYNLLFPRRGHVVTIDRHAADIATKRRQLSRNMVGWGNLRGYEILADGYRLAASYLGILPLELQAATWVHHVDCNGGITSLPAV